MSNDAPRIEDFRVRTTLDLDDWKAYVLEAVTRVNVVAQQQTWFTIVAPKVLWLLLVAAFVVMMSRNPPLIRPLGMVIATAGFFGIWWLQYLIQRRSFAPNERGSFLGDQEFDFDASGFQSRRTSSHTFNRWSVVTDITHTPDHIYVWIDRHAAYVVPARDLPAPMTAAEAVRRLKEFIAAAAADPAPASPNVPEQTDLAPLPPAPPLVAPAGPPTVAQELLAVARLQT